MNKEQTKQAILGFTEFFKGITGNQDLKIPSEIAEKYGIEISERNLKMWKDIYEEEKRRMERSDKECTKKI